MSDLVYRMCSYTFVLVLIVSVVYKWEMGKVHPGVDKADVADCADFKSSPSYIVPLMSMVVLMV